MLGGSLNLTCVAVGSPMPFVKWRRMDEDLTPEHEVTVGKSVLHLNDIRSSNNYTCVASSSLGVIESSTMVKVQCNYFTIFTLLFNSCINKFNFILQFNNSSPYCSN